LCMQVGGCGKVGCGAWGGGGVCVWGGTVGGGRRVGRKAGEGDSVAPRHSVVVWSVAQVADAR